MKTQQIMMRDFSGHAIRQNHITLMFSANDMAKLFPEKNLENWLGNQSTKEFCETIAMREGLEKINVIYRSGKKTGDERGTWLHPLMAVDLAMWLNPNFKYDVLKWVQDHLCIARDNAGESYKDMCATIQTVFGADCHPKKYIEECDLVQTLAGIKRKDRNISTKEQLDKLTKLERWNNKLLKLGIHDITERRVRLIEFMTLDED